MFQFIQGELVEFTNKYGETISGIVGRLNKKRFQCKLMKMASIGKSRHPYLLRHIPNASV